MTAKLTAAEATALQAQADGETAELRKPRPGRRSLLPSPSPGPGASSDQLAAWLTVALGLGADPVTGSIRYGRHVDARMVVTLGSGQRITFDRQADAFDSRKLVQLIVTATGAQVPPYPYADVLPIASAMVRLSELVAEDDDRTEAAEWGQRFLLAAEPNTVEVAEVVTQAGRYEALTTLMRWKPPVDLPPYTPPAERAVIVRDQATGTRLVRTSDFAAHVRGLVGRPLSWSALHSRMAEAGWEHRGRVEQRQPQGHSKAKLHVYAIPAGWEDE